MTELKELEGQLRSVEHKIDLGAKVERLFNNLDFVDIILNNYCKNECIERIKDSINPQASPEERELALSKAKATAYLSDYLTNLIRLSDTALSEVREIQDALNAVRSNEV